MFSFVISFLKKIKYSENCDQSIVKTHDLFEIMNFINPQALQKLRNDPNLYEILKLVCSRPIERDKYIYTKYSAYYVCLIYGYWTGTANYSGNFKRIQEYSIRLTC